jgi:hypothetical protein
VHQPRRRGVAALGAWVRIAGMLHPCPVWRLPGCRARRQAPDP